MENSAFGESPAEALYELEIAKNLWLEAAEELGLKIPEPRYRPAIYAVSSHHTSLMSGD